MDKAPGLIRHRSTGLLGPRACIFFSGSRANPLAQFSEEKPPDSCKKNRPLFLTSFRTIGNFPVDGVGEKTIRGVRSDATPDARVFTLHFWDLKNPDRHITLALRSFEGVAGKDGGGLFPARETPILPVFSRRLHARYPRASPKPVGPVLWGQPLKSARTF